MADPDTTLPTLTGLTFPTTIDVTDGGKMVSLSAGATDVGTGVDYVYLYLDRGYQTQYGLWTSLLFDNATDSFADGTSNLSQYFDATTPAGTYGIVFASVYDKAGNVTQYSPEQLSSMGLATSFDVVSNVQADSALPTLTGLTFPTTIDVTDGGKMVSLSVGATDVGTGIDYVYLYLDHGYQDQYGLSQSLLFDNSTDSFADGTSNLSQYFDATTPAGTYGIAFASVYDKAGNITQYSPDQLSSLGLATSFQVVNRNAAVTASVTGPVTVTEGNGTSFSLGLTLQNVTTADTKVTMSFVAGQSTATNGIDVSVPDFTSSYSISQSPAGSYVITLPSIDVLDDLVAEGTETITVRIQASGQVFDSGTDSTFVTISLLDNDLVGTAKTVQNDFNGDGRSDIVWRNDDGGLTNWLGQANGGFALNDAAAYAQVPLAWKVAGVGDFNGDGRSDIVWRNDNGALTDWLGQGNGGFALNDAAAYAQVSLDWKVAGVGDFNGDGRSDVLWRNDDGALTDWLGQSNGGFAINNAAYTTAPTTWKVAGVGDFNGDGRDDVLWRNDDGALTDWLGQADGGFAINNAAYTEAPTTWKVANVGDYNGDGRDDILWRNDNGALTDWLGQANGGFALNDLAAFTTAPNAWKVADTRPLLGAAATGSVDHGLASLHQAFATEHVTADNLAMGYFASSRLDQNVSVMESIW